MPSSHTIKSIYTDGACLGNPGPGGWGVVVYFTDGSVYEFGGAQRQTTNNRMEMQAATAALEFLAASPQTEPVPLYTDSEYLKKGITQWIHAWKRKGWKTAQGKPVLNQDLWQTLDRLNSQQVQWHYVRGHSGDVSNERCDAIARAFASGQSPTLKQNAALTTPHSPSAPAPATTGSATQTQTDSPIRDLTMTDLSANSIPEEAQIPREVRITNLQNLIETLRIADEIASKGYLISSSELADLMDVNASAVTSRGNEWSWRNWIVSRVRREGNQILWQLERAD